MPASAAAEGGEGAGGKEGAEDSSAACPTDPCQQQQQPAEASSVQDNALSCYVGLQRRSEGSVPALNVTRRLRVFMPGGGGAAAVPGAARNGLAPKWRAERHAALAGQSASEQRRLKRLKSLGSLTGSARRSRACAASSQRRELIMNVVLPSMPFRFQLGAMAMEVARYLWQLGRSRRLTRLRVVEQQRAAPLVQSEAITDRLLIMAHMRGASWLTNKSLEWSA